MSASTLRAALLSLFTFLVLVVAKPIISNDPITVTSVSQNPVIYANFPDPGLIKVGGTWYAFASRTIGSSVHIQIASSPDFKTWNVVNNTDGSQRDALPVLPAWVNQTNWGTWAPDVVQLASNKFVMYFSAANSPGNTSVPLHHCVAYATADNVLGPYIGAATPFICPLSQGGAIDPGHFQDVDGKRYVVYKVDGNSLGHGGPCGNSVKPIVSTPLMLQQVAADGVTLIGAPRALLDNSGASDDGIVEAPALTRSHHGVYFLFFSSGCFATSTYTVSYATASSLSGNFTRAPAPLMFTGYDGFYGPGGADLTPDGSHMVFHAYQGDPGLFSRDMHIATLSFSGAKVSSS
ncbi:hypothetical protein ANO11243_043640 [Dothideomycetidae sp. 11243]|nr:hypothetical protein ANO11243_043640 [fungal sp. No.11243]